MLNYFRLSLSLSFKLRRLKQNFKSGFTKHFSLVFPFVIPFVIVILLTGCSPQSADSIVIYSARKEHLLKPVLDLFTEDTGIPVHYLTGKAGVLNQRLKAEGPTTRADILITVDAGNLWHAKELGLLAPVESDVLKTAIPSHLRDPDHYWFGFSLRARPIVYHSDHVTSNELSTYEDLASSKWAGRLCLRTSKKVYNQSLISMLIHELGIPKTKAIITNWVQNLSAPVFSSDTQVLKAILAGQGDVGIVNSYYFGRLKQADPSLKLRLFWPNQESFGTHINISGAGLVKYSKRKKIAIQFLEWLSQPKAQALFATLNLEYPVNPNTPTDKFIESWGSFIPNSISMSLLGYYQKHAIQLSQDVGYH